jgi:hypothetical protein
LGHHLRCRAAGTLRQRQRSHGIALRVRKVLASAGFKDEEEAVGQAADAQRANGATALEGVDGNGGGAVAHRGDNRDMRHALLAWTHSNWSCISPAIFDSLFQAAMEPHERIGGHYTNERDILKGAAPSPTGRNRRPTGHNHETSRRPIHLPTVAATPGRGTAFAARKRPHRSFVALL